MTKREYSPSESAPAPESVFTSTAHVAPSEALPMRRLAIRVRGVVQGVGFRPFVFNTARRLGLTGWVRNETGTVEIEAQGAASAVDALLIALCDQCPPQARIESLEAAAVACLVGEEAFSIRPSAAPGPPQPTIPADLATCPDCLAEILDPAQRRFNYPFTNCTNCGPRWSIIEGLPYDRPRTSMVRFAMCEACRREYDDPGDRRFHAQPIACPQCGPGLVIAEGRGTRDEGKGARGEGRGTRDEGRGTRDEGALGRAVEALRGGQIVAMKGLGGFQLLVDATDAAAVAELRRRKQRPDKPLAIMLASLDEVRERCELSDSEAAALLAPSAPILLLRLRSDPSAVRDIAAGVAPGNPYLGVMLPYTPLHHLLLKRLGRLVVCTSGNLAEEPIVITTDEAIERLGALADLILTHDRPIVRPVDDSVARMGPDGLQVLRRARGLAPLPLRVASLPDDLGPILAVGGHLKNTVAVNLGSQVVMSAHVGDLDNVLGVEVFERAIDDLLGFFRIAPAAVACDRHPDYASTRHAERLAARLGVPLVRVQHHHAHAAAAMAEHGVDGPLLALSWDGAGYGDDGTVWGGEALICERNVYRRIAHLKTFPLPGGDRAARQPRRSALGLLYEAFGPEGIRHVADAFSPAEQGLFLSMLARRVNTPRTSSMGRLFDAVAALCGLGNAVSFEGQAAMALEFAAEPSERAAYPLPLVEGSPGVLDWRPLLEAVLDDRAAGVAVGRISARFHNALARAAVAVAESAGCEYAALTGGCFQNARLTHQVRLQLLERRHKVLLHRAVPPGDGGIALGQIYVAAHTIGNRPLTTNH